MIGAIVKSENSTGLMEAIPATDNLSIEFEADVWRLVSQEPGVPTTLVEATPEGVVTHPVFRAARALPSATVAPAQIMRVMLGWAPENQAWRLGLLLIDSTSTNKLDTTQMQWCELAAWPDAEYNGQVDQAKQAAQALARLISRPFQFVDSPSKTRVAVFAEPETGDEEVESEPEEDRTEDTKPSPVLPDIEAPALPLRFAEWRLTRSSTGVYWQRIRRWWLATLGRLVGLILLSILFFILGIGSLTRGLAEVEPTPLPAIGLGVAVALTIGMMVVIWRILGTSAVVVDTFKREVYSQGLVLPFVKWRVPFDRIEYVLVTQTPPRATGRRRRTDPMGISQDIWLHIYDGATFYPIVELEEVQGRSWDWDTVRTHPHSLVRRNLQLAQYDTLAHHAAQRIAELISVPVYLDLTS